MIWAGAVGNIFDSLFYGQIFTESTFYSASVLTDFGAGYAPILMGKVVDMFYFPIINTILPDWIPFWGENILCSSRRYSTLLMLVFLWE